MISQSSNLILFPVFHLAKKRPAIAKVARTVMAIETPKLVRPVSWSVIILEESKLLVILGKIERSSNFEESSAPTGGIKWDNCCVCRQCE